ncbi:hypothetical protein DSOUD_2154 [Desulfuromonas soudanensis]|uniref:Uncharacterized protein n=1 Tax=Desulfuromonas soudanensis TaxID=1603606 RepID=A0A0M3QFW1_9BACT|nr:hypothetical protein [Desulfuromonas soudanensis]ALC16919.1 hypothetical protein DSOUD_2154 [Desulfuromonas soudanensis]
MRRIVPIVLLCALLPLHVATLRNAGREWKALPQGEETAYTIPGPVLKLTSLEFDGVAADFMFLRALVFYGSTFERTEKPRVKEWEWRRLYNDLAAATDLDPYFLDPYYFAQANLTWEGNLVRETNLLLEKGSQYRDWDWMLPFYTGFNHFYFLKENDQASVYLMEASRRPGATPLIASLATRLALKGKRTENAIFFLREMLRREEDEEVKKTYRIRLEALSGILALERAVELFREQFGYLPTSLDSLVEAGLISKIPIDPYGGKFFISYDGSIGTTSDLR